MTIKWKKDQDGIEQATCPTDGGQIILECRSYSLYTLERGWKAAPKKNVFGIADNERIDPQFYAYCEDCGEEFPAPARIFDGDNPAGGIIK